MERNDVSEGGRLVEMVDAAGAGVEVEITNGGEVVARSVQPASSSFREKLEAHWRSLPPEVRAINWAKAVASARHDDWQ